jgi:hypothetical protein
MTDDEYEFKLVCDGPATRETMAAAEAALERGREAGKRDLEAGRHCINDPKDETFVHAWWRGYGLGRNGVTL